MNSLRDYIALTKPGVTRMCLLMTGAGLAVSPGDVTLATGLAAMFGAALLVAGANALNMWWERETDARMTRTAGRPLPAGRLQPRPVLLFGMLLAVAGFAVTTLTNPLTVAIGLFALLSYVFVYTPMKYTSSLALVVGAIPGAVPPLMGWTAVTGTLDPGAITLFAIVLIWQIPHFIAIALFRKTDYEQAGIRVLPLVHGDDTARVLAVAWSTALLPVSLLLTPLGVAGLGYLAIATFAGAVYLAWGVRGVMIQGDRDWARGYFFASLAYLPLLTLGFLVDFVGG